MEKAGIKTGSLKVIIAGGGTGGHLFPGIAVAGEILKKYPRADVLFVTAGKEIESRILDNAGFKQYSITVEGLKGMGWKKGIKSIIKLPLSLVQSMGIIKKISPRLILGVGGYSSGPVCLAGWIMGVPTAIHEQNSFPGITNRMLSRIVDRVFISFHESRNHFPGGRMVLTGNPVRNDFFEKPAQVKKDNIFTILAAGGSQGATAINRALLAALDILKSRETDFRVIHQTGNKDYEWINREYMEKGIKARVMPFIQDMPSAYGYADIFVGRAGAGTVFELAALGKPSILIPYPYAANKHQETNARFLAKAGGAEMLSEDNLNGKTLADLLHGYMKDRDRLKNMGEMAFTAARPDAAKIIVDHLEGMMDRTR